MSSRPIVISRGRSAGSTSKTVLRPSGSRLVVTTPAGLWNRNSRVRSIGGISMPSRWMLSPGITLKAGEDSARPLTLTRPAAISSSASRREAMPARASRLAIRSPEHRALLVGRRGRGWARRTRWRTVLAPAWLSPPNGLWTPKSACRSHRRGAWRSLLRRSHALLDCCCRHTVDVRARRVAVGRRLHDPACECGLVAVRTLALHKACAQGGRRNRVDRHRHACADLRASDPAGLRSRPLLHGRRRP